MTVFRGSRYADDRVFVRVQNGFKTLSRRPPFRIPENPNDRVYVTKQGDTFWWIAGKTEIYGEPALYWVIHAANPDIQFFQGQFDGLDAGIELRIPPADQVYSLINGSPTSTSPLNARIV